MIEATLINSVQPGIVAGEPKAVTLDILRGPKARRINILPFVQGGIDTVPQTEGIAGGDEPTDGAPLPSAEAFAIWNRSKVERNAIGAMLLGEVWKQVLMRRKFNKERGSELGLETLKKDARDGKYYRQPVITDEIQDPITESSDAIKHTMYYATQRWVINREIAQLITRDDTTEIDKAYERLKSLIDFGKDNHLVEKEENVRSFITKGVATAVDTTLGLFQLIPQVFEKQLGRQISRKELQQVSRSSFSLAMRLAAGNMHMTIPLLDELSGEKNNKKNFFDFDPHYFVLTPNKKGEFLLEIDQHALESLTEKESGKPIVELGVIADTTGCPAIHAKGEKESVFIEMWNWLEEIATKTYFSRFALAA